MAFDIGPVIIGINLVVGVAILGFASVAAYRLKGSTLFWAALLFLITGLLFVTHAAIEFFTIGGAEMESLYALTALIATIMLAFTMVITDITIRMLGVKP